MKKTVVFGGTFNPFHLGHLKLMKEVIFAVRPDRFILVPTHIPPHKAAVELVNDADRLEMCKIVAKEFSGVEVSDFEIVSGGKSYTVNTLEHFHALYPEEQLYFAMGSDMLISFLSWYRPDRILELATLVCNCRDEADRSAVRRAKSEIEAHGGRCILTECEPLVCSSTQIRQRIENGERIDDLVPAGIAEYVEKRRLYRD